MSHVHVDHDGGLRHFKGKRILVQRDEINYAGNPHPFTAIPYAKVDWEFADYEWEALDGDTVLSDGLAVLLANGHTPGTQGLLLNLPKAGPVLFTSDCCYLKVNIENDLIPGSVWNTVAAWYSLKKVKFLAGILGAELVPGHDPDYYGVEIPVYPEYLE
jgi:glyoxylase-like metal-dependent hydrolase (beta-lactamase superfamily II)